MTQTISELFHHVRREMRVLLNEKMKPPLIDDSPRAANAVAKTPCRLATIDKRRFHFLIQQHPQFATHVMKELADRLRHMNAAAMR